MVRQKSGEIPSPSSSSAEGLVHPDELDPQVSPAWKCVARRQGLALTQGSFKKVGRLSLQQKINLGLQTVNSIDLAQKIV